MGIVSACCKDELCKMTTDNVIDKKDFFLVKIPDSKKHLPRNFTIANNDNGNLSCVDLLRKYINLRPENCAIIRFFLPSQNGKCAN